MKASRFSKGESRRFLLRKLTETSLRYYNERESDIGKMNEEF